MLCDGPGKRATCSVKQFCPFIGVELLSGKLGDEFLVAEFLQRPVRLLVMFSLGRIGMPVDTIDVPSNVLAHPVYGINSPVRVDPELAVSQPLR